MGRRYLPWMLLLAGLFGLRVAAQLAQAAYEVPFLPPFDDWQGSVIPYPALLATQAGILAAMAVVIARVRTDAIAPRPWKRQACFAVGGAYFGVMAFRLVAGLTFLSDYAWFAQTLPAFFHIVLAAFVLTLGRYLSKRASSGEWSEAAGEERSAGGAVGGFRGPA